MMAGIDNKYSKSIAMDPEFATSRVVLVGAVRALLQNSRGRYPIEQEVSWLMKLLFYSGIIAYILVMLVSLGGDWGLWN